MARGRANHVASVRGAVGSAWVPWMAVGMVYILVGVFSKVGFARTNGVHMRGFEPPSVVSGAWCAGIRIRGFKRYTSMNGVGGHMMWLTGISLAYGRHMLATNIIKTV